MKNLKPGKNINIGFNAFIHLEKRQWQSIAESWCLSLSKFCFFAVSNRSFCNLVIFDCSKLNLCLLIEWYHNNSSSLYKEIRFNPLISQSYMRSSWRASLKCCLDHEVVSVGINFNCVGIIGCLEPCFLCFLDFFFFPPSLLDLLLPEELELLE